jgi:hypothetical protein
MAIWIWILAPVLLAVAAWLQRANGGSRLPVHLRAPLDTFLHGLVPALAVLPLAAPRGEPVSPLYPLLAFAVGFCLDFDHPLFFRSLSIETCSSKPTRPPLHNAPLALLAGGVTGLACLDPVPGGVVAVAILGHVLFDATDASGAPWLYPGGPVLRNLPYGVYAGFLALVIGASEALAISGV